MAEDSVFFCICLGPDDNLWVGDFSRSAVWQITINGTATKYSMPTSAPEAICVGSDGNLWISDEGGSVFKFGLVKNL